MYDIAPKRRILMIENEAAIQQVLSFFLRHHGFEVVAVADGREAIRVFPDFQPQLIIIDLMMKPAPGWDVLHWLHVNRLTPQLPVLVVSALVHISEQLQGFEEGAIEYITKPTQPSVIVERVRTLLAMSTEQRLVLHHKRVDEQRKVLDRLYAPLPDEFVY